MVGKIKYRVFLVDDPLVGVRRYLASFFLIDFTLPQNSAVPLPVGERLFHIRGNYINYITGIFAIYCIIYAPIFPKKQKNNYLCISIKNKNTDMKLE
jgi:hypothetical protein